MEITANWIEELEFEDFCVIRKNREEEDLARYAQLRDKAKCEMIDKYICDELFRDWMDRTYLIGRNAIAEFNREKGKNLTVKDGLCIVVYGWIEAYEDGLTPESFIESLADTFHEYCH